MGRVLNYSQGLDSILKFYADCKNVKDPINFMQSMETYAAGNNYSAPRNQNLSKIIFAN